MKYILILITSFPLFANELYLNFEQKFMDADWLVKLGASIEHGKVDDTDSKTDVLVFTEIKYRLN
mgnify:CR=1 FL=1